MLDEKTKGMILEALTDEYKARAFYRLVIKTFGPVQPFINIVEAERPTRRHSKRSAADMGFHCRPMNGARNFGLPPLCSKPVGTGCKGRSRISPCMTGFCVRQRILR
jgi:hypothetical protein